MKARFTFLAIPLMIGVAFAQSQTGDPTQPAANPSGSQAKASASTTSDKPAELKTMTYKGTLVDLGCNGGTQSTASATPATPASTDANANTSANANKDANSTSANRSAGDSSCAVSASTSQFGLKTDAGQTYRFDMVGNQRAQDEFKNNKHWSGSATANKPLKVKISGVVQGDKLIVSSIH